jgi:hypothetical protein
MLNFSFLVCQKFSENHTGNSSQADICEVKQLVHLFLHIYMLVYLTCSGDDVALGVNLYIYKKLPKTVSTMRFKDV